MNLSKVFDINAMSASQLRKRMVDIRKEMDSTSKSLNPDKWYELNDEFLRTKKRLDEVQAGAGLTSKVMDVLKKAIPITVGMTMAYQQFVAQISTGNWGNKWR